MSSYLHTIRGEWPKPTSAETAIWGQCASPVYMSVNERFPLQLTPHKPSQLSILPVHCLAHDDNPATKLVRAHLEVKIRCNFITQFNIIPNTQ